MIRYKFGLSRESVLDRWGHILNDVMEGLTDIFTNRAHKVTSYNFQCNEQVETISQHVAYLLAKTMAHYKGDWAKIVPIIVWTYNTTFEVSISYTAFIVVHGITCLTSRTRN